LDFQAITIAIADICGETHEMRGDTVGQWITEEGCPHCTDFAVVCQFSSKNRLWYVIGYPKAANKYNMSEKREHAEEEQKKETIDSRETKDDQQEYQKCSQVEECGDAALGVIKKQGEELEASNTSNQQQ
jgi:ssDNA-binding Zn-finger/Zn-ribbon topoisomerase 1